MVGESQALASPNAERPSSAGSGPDGQVVGCTVEVVEFDFEAKRCGAIELGHLRATLDARRFVWVDVDARDRAAARAVIAGLGMVQDPVVDEMFGGEPATQVMRYDEYLHLVVAGCRLGQDGSLELERVDAVIAENFLLTVHEGPRAFLDGVKKGYKSDFVRFAKTPSFLVYELWDHLLEHYVGAQKKIEKRVEHLQAELLRAVDDRVFEQVAEIGAALLQFRSILMPARAVLTELSTRRTVFLSEATQAFLANMVGTLERVLQDVLVDRDGLTQSLNLTMSMNAHRTNRAMTKLTILSTIFLPLTFLCGVYGMNFEVLPELRWQFGYLFFWVVCAGIVSFALMLIKRNRML
ncbi:MAG: magnesium transporter CorA family protein [Deltaproteobacteria bacterium]|nr:magnesium transporter CorA family protein [Deltaproteobacteria bacterium]